MNRQVMKGIGILAILLASTTVQAELRLVENFDNMATGSPDGLACTGVMGGTWDTEVATTGNVVVEDNSASRTCRVANLSAGGGRAFGFNGINAPIAPGGSGKVFFRFMVRSDSLVPRAYVGLISDTSDDPITATNTNNPAGFCAGFGIVSDGSGGYNLVKTDGTTVLKTGLAKGRWYNAWIIVDRGAETFDLYSSEATGPAGAATLPNPEDLLAANIPFGAANAEPLNGMIFTSPNGTPQASRTFFDEIYWDGDQGLKPTRKAKNPSPGSRESDVLRDAVMGWTPGPYAATHDVYFGTSLTDVENAGRATPLGVLVSQGQDANTYDPAIPLDFGQTYYWRIDEVNAPPDSTLVKGQVWSFTVEPYGYPLTTPITAIASSAGNAETGPENTINGSGLDAGDHHSTTATQMWLSSKEATPPWIQYELDRVYKLHQMWVWNQNQVIETDFGLGAKQVTIEVSTDGTTWTALTGVPEFAQATASADYLHNTTVDFGGVLAKFVKLTFLSNWADEAARAGLSEVRFFYVPARAYEPTPAVGAANRALTGMLLWRPGREAVTHDLYLGIDPNTLSKVGSLTDPRFDLSSVGLEYDRTYYWKVDEVNQAANTPIWEGDLWSFTTMGYTVVEDFESYDDLCHKIFYTWVDQSGYNAPAECGGAGAPGNGSGAIVGNAQTPYAERTIFHGGSQSMPMSYDNRMNPYYSDAQREWTTPQAWNTGGANTLKVYFRGIAPAFLETSPGNIVMSGTGTDIWNTSDQGRFAYKTLTGDGSITARVESLANTDAWAKAGVMIRETLEAGSSFAMAVYGGQNGVRFQARLTPGVAAITDSTTATSAQSTVRAPAWIKMERKGNQFQGYFATDTAGTDWQPMAGNPQTIAMASTVYIGLAVTSHTTATDVTDVVCGARFSSVSTQVNVSGSWQLSDLGVTQPTGGNAPETFYVAVQDGSGKMKEISHPDPLAIASGAWEEWNVPLSQITSSGVSLSNVKKLIIGVGDRNAPKAGGWGKVYIDDVRLTRVSAP